jgi:hypothetical protein
LQVAAAWGLAVIHPHMIVRQAGDVLDSSSQISSRIRKCTPVLQSDDGA